MVIRIQSFLSDGSLLGNMFWTFCGLKAKSSSRCLSKLLSECAYWEGYHNSLFLGPTEPCWDVFSWALSAVWGEVFRQGCQILLSTCPKYVFWKDDSHCARKTSGRWAKGFQKGCEICNLQWVQPNSLGKVFFRICLQHFSTLWAKFFQPESSKLHSTWPEEHFGNVFPIWAKIFRILSKKFSEHLSDLLLTCTRDFYCKRNFRTFGAKCSAVFSKSVFYIKWRTFPEKAVGVDSESFCILPKSYRALSSKL